MLTFERDVTKVEAVKRLAIFVRFLRRIQPELSYAATYELQKSGRLHINLVVGPWSFQERTLLQEQWGARIWVAWVKEEKDVGNEMSKNYSPESLGDYVSKLDQAVPHDRRVSFSRSWPKMPAEDEKVGFVYDVPDEREVQELQMAFQLGWLIEVEPGVYAHWDDLWGKPPCGCWEKH